MIPVQYQTVTSRMMWRPKEVVPKLPKVPSARMRYALLLLLLVPMPALAQPDTIPAMLQQDPIWHTLNVGQLVARGVDSVILTSSAPTGGIWLSTDRGLTFNRRDSLVAYPGFICMPSSRPAGQGLYLPIWQLDSASAPEYSTDHGLSWNYPVVPQNPQKGSLIADGVSVMGDLFWFSTSQHVIFTRSSGNLGWDTLPFAASSGNLAWYDAQHGLRSLGGKLLARTSDGGLRWDTLTLPGYTEGSLSYPAPNIIYVSPPTGNPVANFVSADTGRTWKTINVFYDLVVVRDSLWYARTTRASLPNISNSFSTFDRSTDQGTTWQPLPYPCPNGPTHLLFADSEHGVSLGTSETNDGGNTWECQDTTTYAGATQYIIPGDFDPSSYYDLALLHGTNYVCLSTDRGSTWSGLFPYPTTVSTTGTPPWGVFIGKNLFIAHPDRVVWTADLGKSFDTLVFNYPGSLTGYIQRAPDGTLWASNDLELQVSRDTGNTWADKSYNIPYRSDSFQLTYTFKPVDSVTGFVRTSNGGILRTTDAGVSWRPDSVMPSIVVDSRHWFNAQKNKYTADAGGTWRTVSNLVSVAVDTLRWLAPGHYTTDAGLTWLRIPGWPTTPSFVAVDSGAAFAGGFPNGSLWRLDMPFYATPKPMFDFSVDDQTWQDVPLQMDTGWVQLPLVIHNKSVSASIRVVFDSVSDPTHFYPASYQMERVTVPKKAGFFGPDGLDSVWFVYHPTAAEQNDAKAYWHSPQVLNSDGKVAVRTDSLHGNAVTASVKQPLAEESAISITPNPTIGVVIVRGASGKVTLTNVLGERVSTPSQPVRFTTEGEISLDLSRLPAGTYFARIETRTGPILRKIVKQ